MKTLVLATTAAVLMTASAPAADIPARMPVKAPPPVVAAVYNWTGFYIGANGGYGWGRKCWTNIGAVAVDEGCFDVKGPMVGGQVGYNWQAGTFVFGVEVSGNWTDLDGDRVSPVFLNDRNHSHVSALLTATARAGVTFDRALLYVRGGAAWVREDHFGTCTGVAPCLATGQTFARSGDETRTGWTVGGGIEYGLTPNFSFAVEGNYANFGTDRVTMTATPGFACAPCVWDIKQEVSWVTGRINYRFGAPLVARY